MATVEAAIEAARAHHRAGNLQQAEDLCRLVIRIDPRHPDALDMLGIAAHQRGQIDKAVQYAAGARERGGEGMYLDRLGTAYRALGRYDEALENFQQAVDVAAASAEARFDLAATHLARGNIDDAEKHYQLGLETQPDSPEVHEMLAEIALCRGEYEEAIEHFEQLIRLKPDSAAACYQLARTCLQNDQPDEAAYHYRAAKRIDPHVADITRPWRTALEALDRIDRLSIRIDRETAADNTHEIGMPSAADLLRLRRELDASINKFENAITRQEEAESVLDHFADRIRGAARRLDPRNCFVFEEALPQSFVRELCENLPADEFFRRLEGQTETLNSCRVFDIDDVSVAQLPQTSRSFWSDYTSIFHARPLQWALCSHFPGEMTAAAKVMLLQELSTDSRELVKIHGISENSGDRIVLRIRFSLNRLTPVGYHNTGEIVKVPNMPEPPPETAEDLQADPVDCSLVIVLPVA